jgi:hypothetical protein
MIRKGVRVYAAGLGYGTVTRKFGVRVFVALDDYAGIYELPLVQVRRIA